MKNILKNTQKLTNSDIVSFSPHFFNPSFNNIWNKAFPIFYLGLGQTKKQKKWKFFPFGILAQTYFFMTFQAHLKEQKSRKKENIGKINYKSEKMYAKIFWGGGEYSRFL